MAGAAGAAATTGVLDVTALTTGTATPARMDPAKLIATSGEMMACLMRMIPPCIYKAQQPSPGVGGHQTHHQ